MEIIKMNGGVTKTDCQTGSPLSSHTSFSLPWESRHSFLVSTKTPAAKNTTQSCTALFPLNTVLQGSGLSTQTRTRTSYHSSHLLANWTSFSSSVGKERPPRSSRQGTDNNGVRIWHRDKYKRDVKRCSKVASER